MSSRGQSEHHVLMLLSSLYIVLIVVAVKCSGGQHSILLDRQRMQEF